MASDNPYIGPRPFKEIEKDLFFGREAEAQELASRIVSHSEVLLYSQSGAGKTSLINARIKPLLESDEYEVLTGARVQGPVAEFETRGLKNIYIFHVLSTLAGNSAAQAELTQLSLKDFFAAKAPLKNAMNANRPRVLVLDQMEELFTFYPDRWRDRHEFFEQLRDALHDDNLHVLISMREDHIAELDPHAAVLPERLRTRFRLERLRKEPALLAITGPIKRTKVTFQEGVPNYLVEDLVKIRAKAPDGAIKEAAGEFVEPVHLQVVCQTLWESLRPRDKEINYKMVFAVGDVDTVLRNYYEQALRKAIEVSGVKEAILREFFENVLITPAGTRGTVYVGSEETGGVPNSAIRVLENDHHILRAEWRGGAQWYELTHDRLIQPIRKSGQQWLLRGKHQALEDRAKAWADAGRGSTLLLNEAELREFEQWLESPEAQKLGSSSLVSGFMDASRAALKSEDNILQVAWARFSAYDYSAFIFQRRYRRFRALIIAAAIVTVALAVISTPYMRFGRLAVHLSIMIGALLIPLLQTYSKQFRDDTKWKLLRVAAERIKREIYRYRTRTGEYADSAFLSSFRSAKLAARVESISGEIGSTPANLMPKQLLRERQGLLTGPEYLMERVQDQILYYRVKTRRLQAQFRLYQILTVVTAGAGVFLVTLELDRWVALSIAIFLAFTALQEMDRIESTLAEFSVGLNLLLNIQGWWQALGIEERNELSNFELLVECTETTLEGELISWSQRTASVAAMLNAAKKAAPS